MGQGVYLPTLSRNSTSARFGLLTANEYLINGVPNFVDFQSLYERLPAVCVEIVGVLVIFLIRVHILCPVTSCELTYLCPTAQFARVLFPNPFCVLLCSMSCSLNCSVPCSYLFDILYPLLYPFLFFQFPILCSVLFFSVYCFVLCSFLRPCFILSCSVF